MTPVEVIRGEGPILLAQPHGGTFVPADIEARLNDTGRALADTDWHIDRVYDGLLPGASVVRATFHRYVIDANRDPSGASLYPGQNTTGLCPVTDFDGQGIYLPGQAPGADEIADRLARFHAPYHAALAAETAWLVTGDKDLLVLRESMLPHGVRIISPADAMCLPEFSPPL